MPKVAKELIHPNSRKAERVTKASHRYQKKLDKVEEKASKLDVAVNKLLWFQENMDKTISNYDKFLLAELVERYMSRFDGEMEQIEIIRSIGQRKFTQHSTRERAITLAQERESMLYKSTGIEIPDLLNAKFVSEFKEWGGDAKVLPRFKLIKFTKPKIKPSATK